MYFLFIQYLTNTFHRSTFVVDYIIIICLRSISDHQMSNIDNKDPPQQYVCQWFIKLAATGAVWPRCLWDVQTGSNVLQEFCQCKKLLHMCEKSGKKDLKSNPGKFLRKLNFCVFYAKIWHFLAKLTSLFLWNQY